MTTETIQPDQTNFLYILEAFDSQKDRGDAWRYEPHDAQGPYDGESFPTKADAIRAGREAANAIFGAENWTLSIDE